MAPKKQTQKDKNAPRRSPRLAAASSSAVEPPKKKQKTTPKPPTPKSPKPKKTPKPESETEASKKTIVVEHCKQCSSFKTRALEVKKGLEEAVDGVKVLVNPQKPRKGCFEVREEGGEAFVTLLDMKRPFTPMKKLNMGKVISEIVEKIK